MTVKRGAREPAGLDSPEHNPTRLARVEISGRPEALQSLTEIEGFEWVGRSTALPWPETDIVCMAYVTPDALHEVLARHVRLEVVRTPEELDEELRAAHLDVFGNEPQSLLRCRGAPDEVRDLLGVDGLQILFHTLEEEGKGAKARWTVQCLADDAARELVSDLPCETTVLLDRDAMKDRIATLLQE